MSNPFSAEAAFDYDNFGTVVKTAVRMLDNVLDITAWPLEEQKQEAHNKRRIGLGFTGLGNALAMLCLKYDKEEGRKIAGKIAEEMRNSAYHSSAELAVEKGAFPLLDADKYLASPFIQRLPKKIREAIKKHGVRNSHLTSIAPTGTISLAFADNASNGIEPAFSWFYTRNKRMADGSKQAFMVEDHAYRLYREMGGDVSHLPDYFVNALEMHALDHMNMVAAVAPFIDSAISKTVNVPADYPFEDFQELYMEAWKSGLKGITTYRPNSITGAVLEVKTAEQPADLKESQEADPDRRIVLSEVKTPSLSSLRWPGRPKLKGGNPSWTFMVENGTEDFAVFVGHVENGRAHPFEVWVNGSEQPRGLGAVAKTLSMDMRCQDRALLKLKLESLVKTSDDKQFDLELGESVVRVTSASAALAKVVQFRVEQLGVLEPEEGEATPVVDALFARKEPKTGPDGTLSWTVDIYNPATNDDFVLGLKELVLPNGQRRPFSVWMSGDYPRDLSGLCKLLSIDMRVIDPAWIGMKLRKLLNYAEAGGNFFAKVPGSEKSQNWPSTVAYIARLMIHRYAMLGILSEEGYPVEEMGIMVRVDGDGEQVVEQASLIAVMAGKECPECHNHSLIKKDGCDFCTSCGHVGSCG